MRGVTETTRGSSPYPDTQSVIAKRNATESDLAQAQAYVGQIVPLTPQNDQQRTPSYRCVNVRLDSLKRLIFDMVKNEQEGGEKRG